MVNIFIKAKEFCKNYKKRIIRTLILFIIIIVAFTGTITGVIYSKAKNNIKYTQDKLQQIALEKVPGEVIKVEKELNFEEAVYEYEFKIKDKENMLQTVKLDSQSGGIICINNEKSKDENRENHRNEIENHRKN